MERDQMNMSHVEKLFSPGRIVYLSTNRTCERAYVTIWSIAFLGR